MTEAERRLEDSTRAMEAAAALLLDPADRDPQVRAALELIDDALAESRQEIKA